MANLRILGFLMTAVWFRAAIAGMTLDVSAGSELILLQTPARDVQLSDDGGVKYMPQNNVVICACAKCGSTSFYQFIYNVTFGHAWPYEGEPFVQAVSGRWEGKLRLSDQSELGNIMKSAYSTALWRDPIERLVSAWASKAACGTEYGTDGADRDSIVPRLQALAKEPKDKSCLQLGEFVDLLQIVHRHGDAELLNAHFLPQHLGPCFETFRPEKWSRATTIANTDSMKELAAHLGRPGALPGHRHGTDKQVQVGPEIMQKLREITKDEYQNLPGIGRLVKFPPDADVYITVDLDAD